MGYCRIFCNRSGVPSGLRAEHPHQWLIANTWYDTPDAINWLKVIVIFQAELLDGTLDKDSKCQTVVLIPKGESGDFRGNFLV